MRAKMSLAMIAASAAFLVLPVGYLWLTIEAPAPYQRHLGGDEDCLTSQRIQEALAGEDVDARVLAGANACGAWGTTPDISGFFQGTRDALDIAKQDVSEGRPEAGLALALDHGDASHLRFALQLLEQLLRPRVVHEHRLAGTGHDARARDG